MYFKQLPVMMYKVGDYQKLVSNILMRISITNELKDNIFLFEEYSITDGETPESVASDFYGSTEYHWVIMLCNEIVYPWNDWALSQDMVIKITKEKYGVANLYTTHHYQNADGLIVNSGVGNYPVSNLDYETRENDVKRNIKILNVNFLTGFVKEFNTLVRLV